MLMRSVIKPQIKKLPTSEPIKAIKFGINTSTGKVTIKISMKGHYTHSQKSNAREGIMDLLTEKYGYKLDNIDVD